MAEDPFRWLEDSSSPATREWTAAQERGFRQTAETWRRRETLRDRLGELCALPGVLGAPRPVGDRLFVSVLAPGRERPEIRVVDEDAAPRTVLDPLLLDPSGDLTVEAWEPSWDGRLLAYQTSSGGTEDCELYVRDTQTLRIVDGPIGRVRRTGVAWLPQGEGFYYVRRLHPSLIPGEEQYHRRVYLHMLGDDPDDDRLIFGNGRGKTQHYALDITPDGRWLVLTAGAGTSTSRDLWVADLSAGGFGEPRFVCAHENIEAQTSLRLNAGTGPEDAGYALTTLDAPRGRIVRTTPARPYPAHWVDVVPQDPEAVLEDFVVLDRPGLAGPVLVVAWSRRAVGRITVHDPVDGRVVEEVPLPDCSTIGPLRASRADPGAVWFTTSGFVTQATVNRYDAATSKTEVWDLPDASTAEAPPKKPVVDGGRGHPAGRVTQVAYRSLDGTEVHMFVIAPHAETDRPRPALLTAYGGFGISMTPVFSPEIVAWVEAGGVYAVANVRGGGENGEQWHRAGMLEKKTNTFDDLEAAGDWLVDEGWTRRDRLGIWGGSNGGLVACAALTRAPAKYAAVAALAPLTDMLRYEFSGLGPTWVDEYGTVADPRHAAWLAAYSPYQQVRTGVGYPAVLVAAFDGDSRVDPLHARKMCAALQAATASSAPILFRWEQGVGHGARTTSRRSVLFADLLAFFADRLDLGEPAAVG